MKPVLVISASDNVATALEPLAPGTTLELDRVTVTVCQPIPPGHKVAIAPIASGHAVVKYGNPIGLASSDIAPGEHVHVHNVASNRGRGDLAQRTGDDASSPMRLAEPAEAEGMES
jgi:altronate dehydratase small subunit